MAAQAPKGQQFPKLDSPLIDEHGNVSIPWYRFFISLWQRTGGSVAPSNVVSLALTNGGPPVIAQTSTGSFVGLVPTVTDDAPVPQVLGASPWVFTAEAFGLLVIDSGRVELARGPSPYYLVGLVGGAISVVPGDRVRLTWFNQPPVVVFFP